MEMKDDAVVPDVRRPKNQSSPFPGIYSPIRTIDAQSSSSFSTDVLCAFTIPPTESTPLDLDYQLLLEAVCSDTSSFISFVSSYDESYYQNPSLETLVLGLCSGCMSGCCECGEWYSSSTDSVNSSVMSSDMTTFSVLSDDTDLVSMGSSASSDSSMNTSFEVTLSSDLTGFPLSLDTTIPETLPETPMVLGIKRKATEVEPVLKQWIGPTWLLDLVRACFLLGWALPGDNINIPQHQRYQRLQDDDDDGTKEPTPKPAREKKKSSTKPSCTDQKKSGTKPSRTIFFTMFVFQF